MRQARRLTRVERVIEMLRGDAFCPLCGRKGDVREVGEWFCPAPCQVMRFRPMRCEMKLLGEDKWRPYPK